MRVKGVLIFIGVLAAVIVLTCIEFRYFFGVRFDFGKAGMGTHSNKTNAAPLGVVQVVLPSLSERTVTDSVGIHAFNEIYAAIGVHPQDLQRWENTHGMYSPGVDASGEMLAPGYPVLSKVASMYIDPVTLTSAETTDLVQECHRAILNSASESAKRELEAIGSLAEKALSNSAVIQFGHP
jgi:hypothetical protein